MVILFGIFSVLAFVAIASADYTGYLPYMTISSGNPFDYTFNVSIDETARTMTFTGIENPLDVINVNYDETDHFTKRINWVWFDGWMNNNELSINQYIGTGAIHVGAATQVANGVYQAQINLPTVPYFGIPLNMDFIVRIDTVNGVVHGWPVGYPALVFEAEWDSQYDVAGYAFGPFLMQARLVNNNQQIELEEWMKEDISTTGLNPKWVVPLTPGLLSQFIGLSSSGGGSSGNNAADAANSVEQPSNVKADVISDLTVQDALAVD